MELIDFNKCKQFNKTATYRLSGLGEKLSCNICYEGEIYKLKTGKKYRYECLGEYIGCHIFELLGIPAQKTLLGTYSYRGIDMLAVICKDFTANNYFLSFEHVVGEIVKTFVNGGVVREGNINDMYKWLEQQPFIDKKKITKFFWEMFITDIYIGNTDRSWDNWGILMSENDENEIAPVFDCGDSLFSHELRHNVNFGQYFLNMLYEKNTVIFPKSEIFELGNEHSKDFSYYLCTTRNKDCIDALKNIYTIIELKERDILNWIEQIFILENWEKQFYKEVLRTNKKHILKKALDAQND